MLEIANGDEGLKMKKIKMVVLREKGTRVKR